MIHVGIDPGKSGFLVAIDGDGNVVAEAATPTIRVGRSRREYDVPAMRDALRGLGPDAAFVTIEKQQAMPGQGGTSMFSVGLGMGLWVGLVVGLGFPYQVVHPRTWRKAMCRDVPGEDPKGRSILAAQRLFPDVDLRKSERARKPDHNKADALLLASYGRKSAYGRDEKKD